MDAHEHQSDRAARWSQVLDQIQQTLETALNEVDRREDEIKQGEMEEERSAPVSQRVLEHIARQVEVRPDPGAKFAARVAEFDALFAEQCQTLEQWRSALAGMRARLEQVPHSQPTPPQRE